ncbi:hypothetical protein ABPG75_011479 [Micractinium tetrahymenae]
MACASSSGVKGPVDFTGFWALVKHEGMDEFLKAAGFPWVVRKAADRFGGSAIDLVAHSGSAMRVTSLNAKGSWTRVYDVDREVVQPNAEGTACKTTSWWEGRVFRSRMEGSSLGVLESWRFVRGNSMAVRTSLRLPPRPPAPSSPPASGGNVAGAANGSAGGGSQELVMFWYFDRMETLQRHVARGRVGGSLLQQIETDQRHVQKATRKDTQYIQDVLLDWQRWRSPADDFIQLASPPPLSRPVHRRRRSPGSMSLASMSKSPSNDSLTALPAGMEVRSEARSIRSDSRSRLAESELSAAALDRMARQAAALALAPPDGAADGLSPRQTGVAAAGAAPAAAAAAAAAAAPAPAWQQEREAALPGGVPAHVPAEEPPSAPPSAAASAVAAPAACKEGEAGEAAGEGEEDKSYAREATLSYSRAGGGDIPVERRPPSLAAAGQGCSLTFRPAAGAAGRPEADAAGGGPPATTRDLLQAVVASGPSSDVATRGSVHGSAAGSGGAGGPPPHHQRSGSVGSAAGAQRSSLHYKSLSADSTARGGSTPGRASPRSTPATQHPLNPTEQVMAFRMHEFADARGIASVVPVNAPNDTSEPQLLSMSPEQAEETAAKLRELELELMLRRQENRRGWPCCCFMITLASDTLPDHLRVWESRLT